MNGLLRTSAGRASTAVALAAGARRLDQVLAGGSYRSRRSRRRSITGAALAFAGPVTVTAIRIRGRTVSLAPPPSPIGKAMLGGYILAGVLTEELAWRKLLTYRLPCAPLAVLTLLSTAGFVLVHLPRDGRGNAPVHTVNTIAWTAAALTSGSIRWSVLSHWAYNCLALTLQPSEPTAKIGGRT